MRIPILFLLLATGMLTIPRCQAQDESYETVFERRANRHTSALKGYGSLLTEFSPSLRPSGVRSFLNVGIELGALINRSVRLGVYGLYTEAPDDILRMNPYAAQDALSAFVQAGGTVDWLIRSEKPLHLTMGTRFGYGSLALNYVVAQSNTYTVLSSSGLLITPNVNLQVSLRPWLRANVGVGYRFAFGADTPVADFRHDFSNPVLQVGIQFGNFK